MKFLKHRVVDASTIDDSIDPVTFSRPLFIRNVEPNTNLYRRLNMHSSSIYMSETDEYIYYLGGEYKIIYTVINAKTTPTQIENYLVETQCVGENYQYLKNKNTFRNDLFLLREYREYLNAVKTANDYKDRYVRGLTQAAHAFEKYQGIVKKQKLLKRVGVKNGKLDFVFENVVAEDTCAQGDDINLGTLKFEVDFINNNVKLKEGDHVYNTEYNSHAVHPHHMSDDNICLGSQSADMTEAIANVEISIIQAMLHKFAHSYTSDDSAGKFWRLWAGLDMENLVWSEYHDRDIEEDDAVYIDGIGYVEQDCTVTLLNGDLYPEGYSTWSKYEQGYLNEDDTVYSNLVNSYIGNGNSVELELDRGFVPLDFEDMVEYEDGYYLLDDMVMDINLEDVPKHLCVHSTALDAYILQSEAIEHNGDYYTAETLPEENTEVQENTEDQEQEGEMLQFSTRSAI